MKMRLKLIVHFYHFEPFLMSQLAFRIIIILTVEVRKHLITKVELLLS